MATRAAWLLLGLLLTGRALTAQTTAVLAPPGGSGLRVGELSMVISLADASLELRRGEQCARWSLAIAQGGGWARPAQSRPPKITNGPDALSVEVTYPLDREREMTVGLMARRSEPIVHVTSSLRRLKGDISTESFAWSCDWAADRYVWPGVGGPSETLFDRAKAESLPHREWLWLPGDKGGLGVLPTNLWGHGASEAARVGFYLSALPRAALLGPGDALGASFAVTFADRPEAMTDVATAVRRVRDVLVTTGPRGFGAEAPIWMRLLEQFNVYYRPAADWTDEVVRGKLGRYELVIANAGDKALIDRCHTVGARVLCRVSYAVLFDPARVSDSPTGCQSLDRAGHPAWLCLDERGQPRVDEWGKAHGQPGGYYACLHQPDLVNAAEQQVRDLMALGFDGIVVDRAGPVPDCYGARLGRHRHELAAVSNAFQWQIVLDRVYSAAKRSTSDKVVVLHHGLGVVDSRWPICDAQLVEDRPYGAESADLAYPFTELDHLTRARAGVWGSDKAVMVVSNLAKVPTERITDAALFSYAWSRLSGFPWADSLSLDARDDARALSAQLADLRMEYTFGAMATVGPVRLRRFQGGIVLLNPSDQPFELTLPFPVQGPYVDLGHGPVTPVGTRVTLTMAPWSGRVLYLRRERAPSAHRVAPPAQPGR
ncbi:MAG: hypothetical protein HZB16_05530 [Armatimonadetes bacterium]|nr:hypothetical protein [Armatimonadota bacterium]